MAMTNGIIQNDPHRQPTVVSFGEIARELGVRSEAVAAIVHKREIPHDSRPPYVFVDSKYLDEIRSVLTPPAERLKAAKATAG